MFSCLINDKISLKQQLLISYSLITIISAAITLSICYGLLYSLKISASNAATDNLIQQTHSNAQALATEIAYSINQEIAIVGESLCMVSARYASILHSYAHSGSRGGTILKQEHSYREYYFHGPCSFPNCPADYGALSGRSRLPLNMPGFINGSLDHSSVYLFSNAAPLRGAVKSDLSWLNITANHPSVNSVIDSLTYQDRDMSLMYERGPNSTVMFYLSTKISLYSGGNILVHRTFPGVQKNTKTYDPSTRLWFTDAPENSYYLYGPYVETFTKQSVVTLSSMKTATDFPTGDKLTTVSAAVLLISELAAIVSRVQYTYGGFGVLYSNKSTQEVLVWKNSSHNTLKEDGKTFKTVADFDLNLAAQPITINKVFEYKDPKGLKWIVTPYPFFSSGSSNDPYNSDNKLVILVFARSSLAAAALDSLNSNIDSTTTNVIIATIITISCTVAATIIICLLVLEYIARPLEFMRAISEEIITISAEDDESKDYRGVLDIAYRNVNLSRTDEVGLLACEYYYMVCILHNKNMIKRETPKYPPNPFHFGSDVDYKNLSWTQFIGAIERQTKTPMAIAATKTLPPQVESNATSDMDVLGSLTPQQFASGYQRGSGKSSGSDVDYSRLPTNTTSSMPIKIMPSNMQGDVEQQGNDPHNANIPEGEKKVGYLTSLKSQLYLLAGVLLSGLLVTMIITVVSLSRQGVDWMRSATPLIDSNQISNMQAITYAKSIFIRSYYQQLTTDVLSAAEYVSDLLNGNLTYNDWYERGDYLDNSYSDNYYDFRHKKIVDTTNFSLYYSTDYAFCEPVSQCDVLNNSTQTTLTSLGDIKLRSYLHSRNFIWFMQISLDENGFTRFLPFKGKSTNESNPSLQMESCPISWPTTDDRCADIYLHSKCNDPSLPLPYPKYDPRCRNWYVEGKSSNNFVNVSFYVPRVSGSGKSAYIPIQKAGSFIGVLNFNYLVSRLSVAFNKNKILSSGYCFLIDKNSSLISHPKLTTKCTTVLCAEGFSLSEYKEFQSKVLNVVDPMATISSIVYRKGGKPWLLTLTNIEYETVQYTVIATVPQSEVEKTSTDTTSSIDKIVATMTIVFVFTMFVLVILLIFFSRMMIALIVNPVNDLRAAFLLIRSDDLGHEMPTKASSRDLRLLLEAFIKLTVALRFGSDSYAKGDLAKAKSAFTEALDLFTVIGNKKGIGSSLNNLSVAELALENTAQAERCIILAIQNAEERLNELSTSYRDAPYDDLSDETKKLMRVLSDRRGNLAVIYLENNRFADAFEVIENALSDDKKIYYVRGLVVKQGILGQWYLKQKEVLSAERILVSALQFIRRRDERMFNEQWNLEEADTAEQIALFNLTSLYLAQKVNTLEAHYLEALCQPKAMHTATVTKILVALGNFLLEKRPADAPMLESIAMHHGFNLSEMYGGGASKPKKVAFAIDYSGSMSGSKIKSAIQNVQNIFTTYMHNNDYIMVKTFNQRATISVPLTRKVGNEDFVRNEIALLTRPTGGTALYSAIGQCLDTLRNSNLTIQCPGVLFQNWLIVLTDGEDNSSFAPYNSAASVKARLRNADVGLIIIGIGNDIQAHVLKAITDAVKDNKGTYIFAKGDKQSIDAAFGRVVGLIQSTLVIED